MKKNLDLQLARSSHIPLLLAISEGVFLALATLLFVLGYPQQIGFIIVGSMAIGFFWLFIQQRIIKQTYKTMLDYKFENLEKNVEKSSNDLLENLSRESTEVVDDLDDFDITKVKNKKDSELI